MRTLGRVNRIAPRVLKTDTLFCIPVVAHESYKGWVVELCNWLGSAVAALCAGGRWTRAVSGKTPERWEWNNTKLICGLAGGPLFDLQKAVYPKTTDGAGNWAPPTRTDSTTLTLVQLLPFSSLTVEQVQAAIVLVKGSPRPSRSSVTRQFPCAGSASQN